MQRVSKSLEPFTLSTLSSRHHDFVPTVSHTLTIVPGPTASATSPSSSLSVHPLFFFPSLTFPPLQLVPPSPPPPSNPH